MQYKLIACDLDGTLLDSNGDLTQENYDAITELSRLGILVVPTTGRAFYESPRVVREHPAIKYFISSNGAIVQDLKNGVLHQSLIPGESVIKINKMARECKLMCTNHKNCSSFSMKEMLNDDTMKEYNISKYFKKQIYDCTIPIDKYYDVFDSGEPCEMIAGCFRDDESKKDFFDEVDKIPDLRVTKTGNCIEIVSAFAGKENGIKTLIDMLGFNNEEIITVGDGENDINMLKMTRNSIAVSNASKEVKNVAGRVGCSNDENIMCHIIKNLLQK